MKYRVILFSQQKGWFERIERMEECDSIKDRDDAVISMLHDVNEINSLIGFTTRVLIETIKEDGE